VSPEPSTAGEVGERRRRGSFGRQLSSIAPLLLVWTVTLVPLYASAAQDRVPTERLFLDPATLTGQPWYTGLLHEAGILGWTVAATAALGGAWVASLTRRRSATRFLASGGLLTLVLLGDEVTGFHAGLGPRLGVPKLVTVAGILALSVVWVLTNLPELRRTRWLTLFAALGALATSVVLDYERRGGDLNVFFEDAPKLLGIVGWATYFVFTAVDITRSATRDLVVASAASA
jgi:hypothetical protein